MTHCATSREVAGSIPDGVITIFHCHNPSGRTMTLGLTRPLTKMISYLLTPWCRVLLETLTGLQLVKKFPAFHGTRRFIAALTSVRHLSLSWASPIQSIYTHLTSWRSILILSAHLRLGLPSGLLPSGFPTKTLYRNDYQEYFLGLKATGA